MIQFLLNPAAIILVFACLIWIYNTSRQTIFKEGKKLRLGENVRKCGLSRILLNFAAMTAILFFYFVQFRSNA